MKYYEASERETVIQFDANRKVANVFSSDKNVIKNLLTIIEQFPEEIKVIRQYDGENDIEILIPLKYVVRIKPPVKRSEAQINSSREKMKKINERKALNSRALTQE